MNLPFKANPPLVVDADTVLIGACGLPVGAAPPRLSIEISFLPQLNQFQLDLTADECRGALQA
jgi:hypothetical protein